jgi:hypothetical protein
VLIGRAYAYGLAAAGETGVTRAIKILKDDLDLTSLCSDVRQLISSTKRISAPHTADKITISENDPQQGIHWGDVRQNPQEISRKFRFREMVEDAKERARGDTDN